MIWLQSSVYQIIVIQEGRIIDHFAKEDIFINIGSILLY